MISEDKFKDYVGTCYKLRKASMSYRIYIYIYIKI